MNLKPGSVVLGLAVAIAPGVSRAGVIGFLGNFDVINATGKTAHGFEIDLEGLKSTDISDTFGGANRGFPTTVERYGAPTIQDTATGVSIIYQAIYNSVGNLWKKLDGTFGSSPQDIGTPSGTVQTPGDNCWSGGGIGYSLSTPCDHFGIGTFKTPTKTTYSWLVEVPNSPGVLTNGLVNLPAPAAPSVVGQQVVPNQPPPPVQMIVQAPLPAAPPPGEPLQWGDPMWVKVYSYENPDPVPLEDLIFGRPPVEAALAEPPEIEWQLLQVDNANPVGPGNGQLESENPGPAGDAVVRRYEFYKYAGLLSQEGEALPTNGDSLATPCDPLDPNLPCDLGTFIGAQNLAINLQGNPLVPPQPGVPEPEGLPIFLTGLGLMAFIVRRRKISAR